MIRPHRRDDGHTSTLHGNYKVLHLDSKAEAKAVGAQMLDPWTVTRSP
ncbi:MAG TPA: hypothetical protein VGL47_08610 [Amycolatopsis sp.]|uniref:Uncharacterized protein n=1 Tax=Amycolatopsis nalaikhensis TaxID=715472 RepID=A0ABY8XDY9_9PSEU|nr:hypothetical protein [Amycolatopsis sp. 2-2]WIV53827.1 hypothetical protein QP939_33750 [Amycolatopsis sp. 2-2]